MKNKRQKTKSQQGQDISTSKEHFVPIIGYDERMRLEGKKYSRLLRQMKKAHWFFHVNPQMMDSRMVRLPQLEEKSLLESKCENDVIEGEGTSSEMEEMGLTYDEITCGCALTMEQVLSQRDNPQANRIEKYGGISNIQHSEISRNFPSQQTRDTNELLYGHGLLFNYTWEWDSTQAVFIDKFISDRTYGIIHSGWSWHLVMWQIPWDSIIVDSNSLDCWKNTCSLSLPMPWIGNKEIN